MEDKAIEEKASIGLKEKSNQGGANQKQDMKGQVGVKVMEAFEENLETHHMKSEKTGGG